ncbi:MAG: hypothetical protein MJE66_20325 [Proteobacteria bacterium]|nr:hypothetical protein [Pseudomonadota bacterium]
MQRTTRLTGLALLAVTTCSSTPVDTNAIAISDVGPFRSVQLENGVTVPMRTGTVRFPDGVTGLLVDYVTTHEFGSELIRSEIPFVWWEAIPEVKRRSLSQGWVRAFDRIPAGEFEAEGHRACLAPDGSTLWLHLDGGLTSSDQAAGKQCLEAPGR